MMHMSSPIATPNRSPAQIIDGRGLAASYREQIRTSVADIRSRGGVVRLDAVLVDSGDSGARVYAESQARTCGELGIDYRLHKLPAGRDFDDIAGRVLLLSSDERVHAIMVHVPLPDGVDAYEVQRALRQKKMLRV